MSIKIVIQFIKLFALEYTLVLTILDVLLILFYTINFTVFKYTNFAESK